MLQNMVRHPNAGAVLVVGLGCENNQVEAFRETLASLTRSACTLWFASIRTMKWRRGLSICISCMK